MPASYEVRDGTAGGVFYPAHVPVLYRDDGAACFDLTRDGWRWAGDGDKRLVALIDVLAAAVQAGLPTEPILHAHTAATHRAIRSGGSQRLAALARDAADALDLVDLSGLAAIAGLNRRTAATYRSVTASGRATPPGIFAAGQGTRRVWLWARVQLENWVATRPGSGWYRQPHSWDVPQK